MATAPENFIRALALWAQVGRRVRFVLAGSVLWPRMTESLEECVYIWMRDHREAASRAAISAELAAGLQWWADGASLDGETLDVRARYKAIEFLLGLSAALPAHLDNAKPLLNALRSDSFESLPDSDMEPVPLKPGLLSLAISALGAWCLSDDFDLKNVNPNDRQGTSDLVLYVSALPVDSQDALVCFASVLRVCPRLLKVALKTLSSRLPSFDDLKANTSSYEAVRIVLSRAAQNAEFDVIEALKAANLHGYLDLVNLVEEASLVTGRSIRVDVNSDGKNMVLESLVPRHRKRAEVFVDA